MIKIQQYVISINNSIFKREFIFIHINVYLNKQSQRFLYFKMKISLTYDDDDATKYHLSKIKTKI